MKYQPFGIFVEILPFQDYRDASDGSSMEHISVYDSTGRAISYTRESFHSLCARFGDIHLIHADEVGVGDLSDESEASFFNTHRKVFETLFFKKVTISLRILLGVLLWIESEFPHNSSLLSDNGRKKIAKKSFFPAVHSSGKIPRFTI